MRLTEVYILKEAKCPKCGDTNAYVGFNSAECTNKNCSNFSQKQYDDTFGKTDNNKISPKDFIENPKKGYAIISGLQNQTLCFIEDIKDGDVSYSRHTHKKYNGDETEDFPGFYNDNIRRTLPLNHFKKIFKMWLDENAYINVATEDELKRGVEIK